MTRRARFQMATALRESRFDSLKTKLPLATTRNVRATTRKTCNQSFGSIEFATQTANPGSTHNQRSSPNKLISRVVQKQFAKSQRHLPSKTLERSTSHPGFLNKEFEHRLFPRNGKPSEKEPQKRNKPRSSFTRCQILIGYLAESGIGLRDSSRIGLTSDLCGKMAPFFRYANPRSTSESIRWSGASGLGPGHPG